MFELLGLDKVKYLGRKLDKKMFYDNGDLSKEDKKIFIDYIDRIEMSYVLNSSTINIAPFVNDEYYYEAIVYLKVKLKQKDKIDKISKIINNNIPNPLVIIYEFDKQYSISTAIKRLSKTEKNKTVVEESNTTNWLNISSLSENDKKFIDSISLSKIPYTNLFDFYKTINDKIYLFNMSDKIGEYEEIAAHGIKVNYNGKTVLAGNEKLMNVNKIKYTPVTETGTVVYIAINGKYAGDLVISDEIKEDSKEAIAKLKQIGIKQTVMLTGDNKKVADAVAGELKLDKVYSNLLPDEKVEKIEEIYKGRTEKQKVAFVGDGINDAPVLARADVGIAMGGLGSDAAIEAADVVIMNDEPSQIAKAIAISKKTSRIVWQNIIFALAVKVIVLAATAGGVSNMWEAVFADVGVALIAVLNAMRAMRIKEEK